VLAAGRAELSVKGGTYAVTEPEVVDAAAALPMLPPSRRRSMQRLGIEHYLTVRIG
jgi:hypothetical protein